MSANDGTGDAGKDEAMKAVIQRVSEASVTVEAREIAAVGPGLLVLLCVEQGDGAREVDFVARKIANLRIFEDDAGKMNRSVVDIRGDDRRLRRPHGRGPGQRRPGDHLDGHSGTSGVASRSTRMYDPARRPSPAGGRSDFEGVRSWLT